MASCDLFVWQPWDVCFFLTGVVPKEVAKKSFLHLLHVCFVNIVSEQ